MKPQWIAYYNGVGEHSFFETHREGPFPGMVATLQELERKFDPEWVDLVVSALVNSEEDGVIVWSTEEHGVAIMSSESD